MRTMTVILWGGVISGGAVVVLYVLYLLFLWLYVSRRNPM